MVRKFKINKQIIYIIGIIIVLYLGYSLFNSSFDRIEGYGNTVCSTPAECLGGICLNDELPVGVNPFCAPLGFTMKEFRAAPGYIDDTTTIAAATFDPLDPDPAKRKEDELYWRNNITAKPTCTLGLNACAKQNPSNLKYSCSLPNNTTSIECNSKNCYDSSDIGNAGKGPFCAPVGFTGKKYRVNGWVNDDSLISRVADWASAKDTKPSCLGGWGSGDPDTPYAVLDSTCVSDANRQSWCSTNAECDSGLCLNPGIALKGSFCAPSGHIAQKDHKFKCVDTISKCGDMLGVGIGSSIYQAPTA